jgi:hypothetical protein
MVMISLDIAAKARSGDGQWARILLSGFSFLRLQRFGF